MHTPATFLKYICLFVYLFILSSSATTTGYFLYLPRFTVFSFFFLFSLLFLFTLSLLWALFTFQHFSTLFLSCWPFCHLQHFSNYNTLCNLQFASSISTLIFHLFYWYFNISYLLTLPCFFLLYSLLLSSSLYYLYFIYIFLLYYLLFLTLLLYNWFVKIILLKWIQQLQI